ncbi:hypothetical protein BCON_0337g00010 [Botryotinia convoluta]|uniref:Uncharacterized protein n=1 Tax=Botryotinia convoluta TaxID=54673 RepID=A0A4Z1HG04_9HELO|nr:hypothetical protein BCON_0337g00010 [Botryotinia convoluta]
MKARNEVNQRVVEAQQGLMLSAPSEERSKLLGHCWEIGFEETEGQLSLPRYSRLLAEHDSEFASALSNVLHFELRLPSDFSHEASARGLSDQDHFYYARLLDRDLPVRNTDSLDSSIFFSQITDAYILSGTRVRPTGKQRTLLISKKYCLCVVYNGALFFYNIPLWYVGKATTVRSFRRVLALL